MNNKTKVDDAYAQLARLYHRWSRPLVNAMQGRLGSRSQAEDTVQTVFTRLAVNGSLPQEGREFAYLIRAAANHSVDQFRRQARDNEHAPVSMDAFDGDELAGIARVNADEVLDQQQRRQQMTRLREALAELPGRQRQAFALHMIEGYSQQEVAARMGISLRMVSRHVSTALAYCEMRLRYGSLEQMQRLRDADDKNTR